jgi:hypothetical protein
MNTQQPTKPVTIEESIKRLNDTANTKQLIKQGAELLDYLKSLDQQYTNENK